MKGIICYYSGSGNTKLACKYIQGKIQNADLKLHNIVNGDVPYFDEYDIAGFATFTDFGGVPRLFHSWFSQVDTQPDRPAFVFNTYGYISAHTLKSFAGIAGSRGFNVISGHSLHTLESYPPMRVKNKAYDDAPNPKELKRFDAFILRLDALLETIGSGASPENEKIKDGLIAIIFPQMKRTKAKKGFGMQDVNEALCTECGICQKLCPYEAVEMAPKPVFDHAKCCGCWACYNHCPEQAIYTEKFKREGQYPKPSAQLKEKLVNNIIKIDYRHKKRKE